MKLCKILIPVIADDAINFAILIFGLIGYPLASKVLSSDTSLLPNHMTT